MTRAFIIVFIAALSASYASAGQSPQDSTTRLQEVTVNAYFTSQPLFKLTGSAGVISSAALANQSGASLLPAFNTVPGVRMEERSPGSYRLSIRGSLLRSPFGVRNVKVYYDELPLTDAGGNTYLNILDASSIDQIEILKGPDGSLFGANSGGVVRFHPAGLANDESTGALRLNAGSYGLFHQQFSIAVNPSQTYRLAVNQGYQRTDGYRENSAMKRTALQTIQRWRYQANREMRLIALYSDLQYRTPGGLTAAQYAENPRQARPAAGALPGAVDQQAGVINKTLFGGVVHETGIGHKFKHVAAVFGMLTDFRNPFITNYELRDEYSVGFRTYLNYADRVSPALSWQANLGMEWQHGSTDVSNYDNHGGTRGDAQAADVLRSRQYFYFARFGATVFNRLFLETSLSLNYYGYRFRTVFPEEDSGYRRKAFDAEWMPRVALSYELSPQWAWRGSVSRGYSPPTIAEVRPSDNIVNTGLEAETGWNHEVGFRWQSINRRVRMDGSVFYYRMEDAIIRQLRENGAEFFSNAGEVKQRGLELSADAWAVTPHGKGLLRGLELGAGLTLSRFRFGDYHISGQNFTGNKLTGVPAATAIGSVKALLPEAITLFLMHNYTSAIPLNDANTVFAESYHLLQAKFSWDRPLGNKLVVQVFAGGDNLLNERYSLGNDINAFVAAGMPDTSGRFFNAAAPRNFYGGLALRY